MDLEKALTAHAEWKIKLRGAIQKKEHLDASSISSDRCCPLGQWLHGEAKQTYAKLPTHVACVARHAEFHRAAGAIAHSINVGKYAEAEVMLANGSAYAAASNAVAMAIMALRREAKL